MKLVRKLLLPKNGKPVSKLVPYREKVESLFGLHRGKVSCQDDLIEPVGEPWEAES